MKKIIVLHQALGINPQRRLRLDDGIFCGTTNIVRTLDDEEDGQFVSEHL